MFDFSAFMRFVYLWFLRTRWTRRRALVSVAFVLLVPLLEVVVWTTLWLDRLIYPGFRRTPVRAPIFIVGHPRSGTTFLHRLMAEDTRQLSTMKMWEILLAPSVTLRRLVSGLVALDRRMGGLISRRWQRQEARWHEQNPMHEVSLGAPEEDDYLLLHAWSALTIGLSAGLLEEARPYVYFDQALPRSRRARIMRFYKDCLQRHLYAHHGLDGSRHYLAKNPALCPKLDSVLEAFPDARFVYLVRNPLEVVPSYLSMMHFSWETIGVPSGLESQRRFLIDMAKHWYLYPLERLRKMPADRYLVVRYDDLVTDPAGSVRAIYGHFGLDIDGAFERTLEAVSAQAGAYRSRHVHRAGPLAVSEDVLAEELREVMEAAGFT